MTKMRAFAGFTLIEAIVVILITGILAGIVAVFITRPVEGYADSVRRAELTDAADVALRRIARDVRLALPNSVRVMSSGGVHYIEFIITQSGGRYRDRNTDGSTGGDSLSFTDATDWTFDVLGVLPAMAANDFFVVYNLGVPGSDAYAGNNRAVVQSIAGNTVTLGANPFASQSPPLPSPSSRFQVVPGDVRAVTYACPAAAGNLTRHWNYGFNAGQIMPAGGSSGVLAAQAACVVDYVSAGTGRNGLLYISLTLSSSGESVTLFQQIHVDNSP